MDGGAGAGELYEHRADAEEWEDEPAEVSVRPRAKQLVSFRMTSDELDGVQAAAAGEGVSVSEFIRAAIQVRLSFHV